MRWIVVGDQERVRILSPTAAPRELCCATRYGALRILRRAFDAGVLVEIALVMPRECLVGFVAALGPAAAIVAAEVPLSMMGAMPREIEKRVAWEVLAFDERPAAPRLRIDR